MIEHEPMPANSQGSKAGSIIFVDEIAKNDYGVAVNEELYTSLLDQYNLPNSPERLAVNIVFASPGYGLSKVFHRGSMAAEQSRDGVVEKHHIFVHLYDCIDYADYYGVDPGQVLNRTLLHETGHYMDYLTPFGDLRCSAAQARDCIEEGLRPTRNTDTSQLMTDSLLPLVGAYPILSSLALGTAQAMNVASHRIARSFSGGRLYRNSFGEMVANNFADQNAALRIITVTT